MKLAWILIFLMINVQAFGQNSLADIIKIDGDRISAETAKKHLKQNKIYYLVVGEFATIPFQDCEQKIWNKFGCEVKHISNYGLPEVRIYNQVVFTYLDSILGKNWQIEKDSLFNNCLLNYKCGLNVKVWQFDGSLPLIIFNENSGVLNDKGKCFIDEIYYSILTDSKVKEITLTGGQGKNEKNKTLYLKRCESVKNYLIKKGINKDKIKIDSKVWVRDFCRNQPDCTEDIRKWNRAVVFNFRF